MPWKHNDLFAQLARLTARINRTNLSATLADGTTLTDALARRDVLALRFRTLESIATAAAAKQSRYSRSEIKLETSCFSICVRLAIAWYLGAASAAAGAETA